MALRIERPGEPYRDGARIAMPVLREYALVADGQRGALIGPAGEIAWLCAPSWHSDPAFSSILGGPGQYVIGPADGRFTSGGNYEDGTLIWRSRWITATGVIECRQAMALPADRHTAVLLRRIIAVETDARVTVSLAPGAGFAEQPLREASLDAQTWTMSAGSLTYRWTGAPGAARHGNGFATTLEIPAGEYRDLVLEISDRSLGDVRDRAGDLWDRTERAWREAVPTLPDSLAERDTRHGYAVMRGLTSSSGGMVAAATTGLPERAEQGRNYDYRYCWIRDQCYAGRAVAVAGPHPLLDDAVRFVGARLLADGPELEPAYTLEGDPVPGEWTPDLPGYPGARVTVGNHVRKQSQLDAFGEALLLFAAADVHGRLDTEHWRAVETAVAAIEKRWDIPDAGIWELDNRRWAHSRLICAAGLRAISATAPSAQAARWTHLADTLIADTTRRCVHPSGRWQRSPRDERVDAALLLPALRGAIDPADPRSRRTLDAVRRELGREEYVYRFRHRGRQLAEGEGAFLLCGFVMALAEHQQGHEREAVRWFERNRAGCGPTGLFTEEFDVIERQLRGNLPQAFVHALLFEAAHRLGRPWAEGEPAQRFRG